jgi:hypothetical protein
LAAECHDSLRNPQGIDPTVQFPWVDAVAMGDQPAREAICRAAPPGLMLRIADTTTLTKESPRNRAARGRL